MDPVINLASYFDSLNTVKNITKCPGNLCGTTHTQDTQLRQTSFRGDFDHTSTRH